MKDIDNLELYMKDLQRCESLLLKLLPMVSNGIGSCKAYLANYNRHCLDLYVEDGFPLIPVSDMNHRLSVLLYYIEKRDEHDRNEECKRTDYETIC